MRKLRQFILMTPIVLASTLLAACNDQKDQVSAKPVEISRDAIGYYCHMIVTDHSGPKGQIQLTDKDTPLWFSSVRDAIAFTMLPEEPRNIKAIFVNDAGKLHNWDSPEPGTWIDAKTALYVIGSSKRGGMGALEAVPFSDRAQAENFKGEFGGTIVPFTEIPKTFIFAEATENNIDAEQTAHHHSTGGDDHAHTH